MKLEFKGILVPNFVKAKQGRFDVADLDEQEVIEYTRVWTEKFKENRERRQ